MDGRNPAPPKTPWNDDSPVNGFPCFKVVQDFVQPQYFMVLARFTSESLSVLTRSEDVSQLVSLAAQHDLTGQTRLRPKLGRIGCVRGEVRVY